MRLLIAIAGSLCMSFIEASSEFHLSLVGDNAEAPTQVDYMLDWITANSSESDSSRIIFGTKADDLQYSVTGTFAGEVEEATGTKVTCWYALLPGLEPGSKIYYRLEDEENDIESNFFVVDEGKTTWAVFGDMGAPIHKQASGISFPALKNALDNENAYQGILNIGDLGYELVRESGKSFMEEFATLTSRVPMHTTVGNHEYQYGFSPDLARSNYFTRFAGLIYGAGSASGSISNEFYSFNSGLIHFVFINTEVYGDEAFPAEQEDGSWESDDSAREATRKSQVDWLIYDLSRVKRSVTPYIVVCGHRPPYKTPTSLDSVGNKFGVDIIPLLSKYQVDLYLSGHEHTYMVIDESNWKEYIIPPIIIAGSAGNNEFIRSKEKIGMKGFKEKTLIPKYGYGYLSASKLSLSWKWGSTASDGSKNPTAKDWEQEDEYEIMNKNISKENIEEGTPVETPSRPTDSSSLESGSGSGGGSGNVAKASSDSHIIHTSTSMMIIFIASFMSTFISEVIVL